MELVMRRDVLTQHATDCRQMAGEYASEERDFLLHIASEFDRLAERDREEVGNHEALNLWSPGIE